MNRLITIIVILSLILCGLYIWLRHPDNILTFLFLVCCWSGGATLTIGLIAALQFKFASLWSTLCFALLCATAIHLHIQLLKTTGAAIPARLFLVPYLVALVCVLIDGLIIHPLIHRPWLLNLDATELFFGFTLAMMLTLLAQMYQRSVLRAYRLRLAMVAGSVVLTQGAVFVLAAMPSFTRAPTFAEMELVMVFMLQIFRQGLAEIVDNRKHQVQHQL